MTLGKKLRLGFIVFAIAFGLYFGFIIYKSILPSGPAPIPSRQITQKSLHLRELWRRSIRLTLQGRGKSPRFTATNSTVIIADYDSNSLQYQLQILDTQTGKMVSNIPIPKRIGLDSLIADNNNLYVAIDKEIEAYELPTGQLFWQSSAEPSERSSYKLTWLDGNVVNYSSVLGEDYQLMSVYDSTNGTLVQQKQIPINPMPLLTTAKIEYKGEWSKLLAFDRYSGQQIWQTPLSGYPQLWPVLVESNLLIATYNDQGSIAGLHSIDATNGSLNWYALKDDLISNFAVIDRTVYAIRRNGDIVGLDLDTGQEVGTIKFNTSQTDANQNAYWLTANGRKLFAYFGDSRELIAFQ